MAGRDGMDDGRLEDALGRALRRSEDEARPREEFARALRERFVRGELPSGGPLEPAAPARRALPIARWFAYPAAAALLLAGLAMAGAFAPRPVAEPPRPVDPPRPSPVEVALTAAERRIGKSPHLAGRTWKRTVVEGRPCLLPAEAAFADGAELKKMAVAMGKADAALSRAFPDLAGRAAAPAVAVVAPTRRAFEALVAPHMAPTPLGEAIVAFSLDDLGVLLVAPEALVPGSTPCELMEEMDVVHEAVHAWLRARRAPGVALPLWVDEGLAGAIAEGFAGTKGWCRKVLAEVAEYDLDPFTPGQVLECPDYAAMARQVASRAPCEERPYSLMPAFYAHAEALAIFALDEEGGGARPAAFRAWLARALEGKAGAGAASVATGLGFESVEALFLARDEWLRK